MSFEYEEKPSGSRFVDIIWRTYDTSDGTYLAAADACWDMIFIRSEHGNRALLSGPSTQITPVPAVPAVPAMDAAPTVTTTPTP